MTRSRKVEAAIKANDKEFAAFGADFEGADLSEYTNTGADSFCPFIDNKRLGRVILAAHGNGDIHRSYPAKLAIDIDPETMNQRNRTYHFVQLHTWVAGQFCQHQRDIEKDYEKCECRFKNCSIYKEYVGEI